MSPQLLNFYIELGFQESERICLLCVFLEGIFPSSTFQFLSRENSPASVDPHGRTTGVFRALG